MIDALVNALASAAVLAPAAVAFTLLFALFRFANFAVGAFVTFGAFATWVANVELGMPLVAAAAAGAGVTAIALLLTDRLVFRGLSANAGPTLLLVSVALSLVVENLLRLVFGSQIVGFDLPLTRPFLLGPITITQEKLVAIGLSVFVVALLAVLLARTAWGRALRAVADDADLAAIRGVPVRAVRVLGLGVAGLLIGLSGTLAGLDLAIEPGLGWSITVPTIAAAVLGGLGSPIGAAVGAVLVGLAEEITVLAIAPTYKAAVGFVIIAAVLLVRPNGLFGRGLDRR